MTTHRTYYFCSIDHGQQFSLGTSLGLAQPGLGGSSAEPVPSGAAQAPSADNQPRADLRAAAENVTESSPKGSFQQGPAGGGVTANPAQVATADTVTQAEERKPRHSGGPAASGQVKLPRRRLALAWIPLGLTALFTLTTIALWPENVASSVTLLTVVTLWVALSMRLAKRLAKPTLKKQQKLREVLSGVAQRVTGTETSLVPAEDLRAGEELFIGPGEVLLADAVVVEGDGLVRPYPEATDSWAIEDGLRLPAGARVLSGQARVVCASTADERTWHDLAFGARESDSWLVRSAVRTTREAAPALAALSLGLCLWWTDSWYIAISVGLANFAALQNPLFVELQRTVHRKWLLALYEKGVHVGPGALDAAAQVTQCVFCTRGTVLSGEPEVAEIHALRDATEEEVLALAAGAESVVEHPAASSILRAAHARGIGPDRARGHDVTQGMGVACFSSDGRELVVGSRDLLLKQRISIAIAEDLLRKLESRGRMGILVAREGHLVGVLALHDALRVGSKAAVQLLIDGQIEPILLSGDTRSTCEALGHALSVEHIRPEVPARQRGAEVQQLAAGGSVVAVVGHSPLDDSALSGARAPIVLEGAALPQRRGTLSILSSDVLLAAEALLAAARLRREGGLVWAISHFSALAGVLAASSLLFPPIVAPVLAGLGGIFSGVWVWTQRQDCSPSPRYGTPSS